MLKNDRERKICEKYRKRDENDLVQCHKCPLLKGDPKKYDFKCKANSHYNRHTGEWEMDEYGKVYVHKVKL